MPQIWQGPVELDLWTYTNLGSIAGTIQFATKGVSGSRSSDYSITGGTIAHMAYTSGGLISDTRTGTERAITIAGETAADMRVRCRFIADNQGYAGTLIGRRLANGDYYLCYLAYAATQFVGFRYVAGVFTQLFVQTQAYTDGVAYVAELSLDGGTQTFRDITNNRTETTTDGNISGTGGFGVRMWHNGGMMQVEYFRSMTTATSGTALSTTFDAGSAVPFDTLLWGESLDGGNITWDVSAVASGSPSYGITALSDPEGSSFTRTSARYWHVRANFTRTNTTQNPAVLRAVALADNNAAASGGGATYAISGGGGGRRKTRVVVIPESQFDKLKK